MFLDVEKFCCLKEDAGRKSFESAKLNYSE
jgi:hypothetical protein